MTEFIVRARNAPVDPDEFLAARGQGFGIEYLPAIIVNGLFVSKGHRNDAVVTLVFEKSRDFSRTITFSGDSLGSLPDLNEQTLLQVLADILKLGRGLAKEAAKVDSRGISISTMSFERLVKLRSETAPCFLLDRKGADIRKSAVSDNAVFVMTDHTPMPKNTFKSMARQGIQPISLGPRVLFASQCITLIHNEVDRLSQ